MMQWKLIDAFELYYKEMFGIISPESINRYRMMIQLIREFETYRQMIYFLEHLKADFYCDFENWCIQEKHHDIRTIKHNLRSFKIVLRYIKDKTVIYNPKSFSSN